MYFKLVLTDNRLRHWNHDGTILDEKKKQWNAHLGCSAISITLLSIWSLLKCCGGNARTSPNFLSYVHDQKYTLVHILMLKILNMSDLPSIR
jgi:hypothetical protein